MTNDETKTVCEAIEGGFNSEAFREWEEIQESYELDHDEMDGMHYETNP